MIDRSESSISLGERVYVASLHRYPVKSLGGAALSEAALQPAGLAGDRAFALLDLQTGSVVSTPTSRASGRGSPNGAQPLVLMA